MKSLFTTAIVFLLLGIPALPQGDSVTSLIFTEYSGNNPVTMYFELTNMGNSALDLSNFRASFVPEWSEWVDWSTNPPVVNSNEPARWGSRLKGILEPGESVLVNNVFDSPGGDDPDSNDPRRWSWNKTEFTSHKHHFPVHYPEPSDYEFWYKPELEMWGKDSVSVYEWLGWAWNGKSSTVLYYIYPDGDSVIVDGVNFEKAAGSNQLAGVTDVAGVTDATVDHILVRKATITNGNWDWSQARGVDLADSEWIPIPAYNVGSPGGRRARPYTTVGTHGDYSIDLKSETITIDDVNNTLTVPWGILKHDSILNEFTIGPGMAWIYTEDELEFADSAYATVQDGDILRFMACGNDYEVKDYTIQVAPPADNMALVFPKRRMRFEAMLEEDFDGQKWGGEPYYVTEGAPMDSIGNVPFATRIDTLYKYLEKAPEASWEIAFVDTLERVDVKDGDKLVITAKDGTTKKEYYIIVLDYEKSDNALLGAITWPDKPVFMENWNGDTIPNFSPTSAAYQITVPYNTIRVPALTALRQDYNARISVNRATNLNGSLEERTTTFVVTAEDGITEQQYTVTFSIDQPPENSQPYVAKPFISEIVAGKRDYYEFANVGGVPLDLSRYLFVHSSEGNNPADAIRRIGASTSVGDFTRRYGKGYVPGYKFSDDTVTWQANPAKLYYDAAVDPVIDPGDVFLLGNPHASSSSVRPWAAGLCDVVTSYGKRWTTVLDTNFNTWGVTNLDDQVQMHMHWKVLYLFHIDNDSILDGTKPVNADPADYTLVDMVGDAAAADWTLTWYGDHQKLAWENTLTFRRQPWIYEGNTQADSISNRTEWISNSVNDEGWNTDRVLSFIGSHSFDPVTFHISTITSSVYEVSVGYVSPQTLKGEMSGTTVEDLFGKISSITGQTISIIGKDSSDLIANDDTLMVVSANGENTTKYAIIDSPLDDNAVITLVNDPSGLSIEIDGDSGLIKGVEYGALLRQYIDSLSFPELATSAIIDENGSPIPMQRLNYDTVMVNTLIDNNVYIEVVAQNGTTRILYKFEPSSGSSDAFVISSIYDVDQENLFITNIAAGTGTALFWDNIDVVKGATATLIDKAGFERLEGTMSYDDKLEVVSEDSTVTTVYYLDFLGEMNADGNAAPEVVLAFTDSTLTGALEIDVAATVNDDGLLFGTLAYKWEVIEGVAANVTIADDAALITTVTFSELGTYKLQFSATDGQKTTERVVTIHVEEESTIGIDPSFAQSLKLYPNPAGETLTIELVNFAGMESTLAIYDLTGRPVYMRKLRDPKTVMDLDLKTGMYIVRVTCNTKAFTQQLKIVR